MTRSDGRRVRRRARIALRNAEECPGRSLAIQSIDLYAAGLAEVLACELDAEAAAEGAERASCEVSLRAARGMCASLLATAEAHQPAAFAIMRGMVPEHYR